MLQTNEQHLLFIVLKYSSKLCAASFFDGMGNENDVRDRPTILQDDRPNTTPSDTYGMKQQLADG